MAILSGHFTMVLLVGGAESLDVGELRGELEGVATDLGLEAVSLAEVADAGGGHPEPTHIATVYGADHPGIVHAVANAVAAGGCNITDLSTRLSEGGAAQPLYVLMMEIAAPADRIEELRLALEQVGRDEGVQVSLRELEHDEL